ncbi:hypothetical protein [Kriegella aquimaris]|uniref:Uncharacterized protein n=1 Tax=Kriegella aquimaris TaxID=192904 RepID=A0A1G9XPU6_9FLAO|nr:hypothetical protein [Kriegella aquimaris]SDM98283.1 hypothetical protein SAMN04488514_11887 [Kriegella aquimaris]
MRKISLMLIAAMLLVTGSMWANGPETEKPTKQLTARIWSLLKKNAFDAELVDQTADVRFIVNRDHEIVILTIDSNSKELEYAIKYKLNYKKVEFSSYKEGETYIIPIRVVAGRI